MVFPWCTLSRCTLSRCTPLRLKGVLIACLAVRFVRYELETGLRAAGLLRNSQLNDYKAPEQIFYHTQENNLCCLSKLKRETGFEGD